MFGTFFSKANNFTKFFGIFFLVLFFSGCSQSQNFQPPQNNKITYQVSSPWDLELYESFYKNIQDPGDIGIIHGGIIPHHLIAGHLDARFFENLKKQNPSTIVLIGPNHFGRGYGEAISTVRDWKTLFGITQTDLQLVSHLVGTKMLTTEEHVIAEEHSVYSLIPFITNSLPDTNVLPIIVKNNVSTQYLDALTEELIALVPEDTVFVSSIDFSHYQTVPVSHFHDELSKNVIKTFDFNRLEDLEIDSIPSLYLLMKLMKHYGTQDIVYELHTNSGELVRSFGSDNTTSHYSPYFVRGTPETEKISSLLYLGTMPADTASRDLIFTQISGQENRFLQGMDDIVFRTESSDFQLYNNVSPERLDEINNLITQTNRDPIKNLLDEASSGIVENGFALGLVFYPDYVSLYIFPFDLSSGELRHMKYSKAQEYLKKLIDRAGFQAYTFDNFHTIINL